MALYEKLGTTLENAEFFQSQTTENDGEYLTRRDS